MARKSRKKINLGQAAPSEAEGMLSSGIQGVLPSGEEEAVIHGEAKAFPPGLGSADADETPEAHKIPTAAYIRLSMENNGAETDDSIQSQMALVYDYIRRQPDLKLMDTYVDNGYTGTNFDRPEFQRLMQDVRTWRIRCIVVKDLSRFGRDYLETGYYLETVFPKIGVRLIAVNDCFDSTRKEDMESLAVPITNLVNSIYAKDISKKTATALALKRNRGDLPTGTAPYGYIRNAKTQMLLVDEDKACYVRAMFHWKQMGLSYGEIKDRLQFLQAPGACAPNTANADHADNSGYRWEICRVSYILQNPCYAGDTAYGKSVCALYKGQATKKIEKKDWIIRKNTHEAVVLRSDFDAVQEMVSDGAEKTKARLNVKEVSARGTAPLAGMIYCSCCKGRMRYENVQYMNEKEPHGVFQCRNKKQPVPCRAYRVPVNLVKMLVMDQIHLLVKSACERKETAQKLLEEGDDSAVRSLKKKITHLSFEARKLEGRLNLMYMDYADGSLEKEEYQYLKEHYISQKQETERRISNLSGQVRDIEKKAKACVERAKYLEQFLDRREYDEALVRELVDAVYIGADNTVEVRFKCNDVFQELVQGIQEMEAEDGEN